jgi:murein DD-endopeptidase MepM/ murein hydrolase activator NlpD
MADNTLASLTERIKQVDRGATVIDEKTTVVLSNTLTGIQNAFNKILTYSKNMNKIQEAKLEDTDQYNKEAQLEAPRPQPIVATSETQSESNLAILIPSLLKVIKKLDQELQYLDLSGQECVCDDMMGDDGFDDDDIDSKKKKKRRKPNSRRTRTRTRRAPRRVPRPRMPRIPRVPAGAGVVAAGAAFAVAATGSILYGIDSFMKSTNVDTRKKQDQGISKFGISGNNTDGYVINGKNVGGYKDLPEYYKNVVDGYGANNRGGSAERARQYVQSHNPDGSTKQAPRKANAVVEAPEIVVTAPTKKDTTAARQDEKLVKAAVKAASTKAIPVKKAEPTKAMSRQGNEWTGNVSSFIGDTYRNVTSFMGGFLAKLASLGSQLGSFLSGGAESLAGMFGFGGGAGFQEANLGGVKGEWAKDASFITGVNQLAKKYDIDAGDLLGLMYSESGVNPQAVNPSGGATGLIQFMPTTAKAMGTSTAAIYKMNRTQQLALVDRFFAMNKLPKGATASQLYATVFLPAYNRKAENFVIARPNGPNDAGKVNPKWYTQNAGLDYNRDGVITVGDLGRHLSKKRQAAGLGASQVGSGFRALGNLAMGAASSFGGAVYEAATSAIQGIGDFIMPVASVRVTSGFGLRKSPENTGGKGSTNHRGVDFGAKRRGVAGDPIYAAAPGIVQMARPYKGYGNFIKIAHGKGMETRYGHLMSYNTFEGKQVQKGEQIARMGGAKGMPGAGTSSGLHLHFELIKGGTPIDPLRFLGISTVVKPDPTATEPGNEQSLKPGQRPAVKPNSQLAESAQQVAIDKKKQKPQVRSTSTSRGTPGRVVPVPGPGKRPAQKQKKSTMDQFLGYFGAA